MAVMKKFNKVQDNSERQFKELRNKINSMVQHTNTSWVGFCKTEKDFKLLASQSFFLSFKKVAYLSYSIISDETKPALIYMKIKYCSMF